MSVAVLENNLCIYHRLQQLQEPLSWEGTRRSQSSTSDFQAGPYKCKSEDIFNGPLSNQMSSAYDST